MIASTPISNVEKLRRVLIVAEPLSVENERLTPSMKIRRHVIRAVYGARLDALYRSSAYQRLGFVARG